MTRTRCLSSSFGVLALLLLAPATARAQSSDPAAAADLFHQGRVAMSEERYAEACAKFDESERLEPRVGTVINLALCEEARGRVATARELWEQATDLARTSGDARLGYTAEHLGALEPRVPHLTVRLKGSAPPGTVVRRDGVELGPASIGAALALDPGAHTVLAVAAHHADGVPVTVELREGESKEVEVEPGPILPEPTPVAPRIEPPAPQPPPESRGGILRTSAVALGAAGIVGLGVGAFFGVQALNERSGAPGICNGDHCDDQGAAVRRGAIRDADASTIAFAVGGAFVATGVVLWLLAPSRPSTATSTSVGVGLGAAPQGGRVSLVGTF